MIELSNVPVSGISQVKNTLGGLIQGLNGYYAGTLEPELKAVLSRVEAVVLQELAALAAKELGSAGAVVAVAPAAS